MDPVRSPQAVRELPNQIAPAAVRQVKQATVYLRVTSPGGQVSQGSGFRAANGVVVKLALDFVMRSEGQPKALKGSVRINSGLE